MLPFARKNTKDGHVGLDVDGAFLAAVEVSDGRIERAASRELEEGVMRDGEIADRDRLIEALKSFFADESLPKRVHLGIANQQIAVRHLELPQIPEGSERDAAIRFQAADAIPMPLEEAVLDYQTLGHATGSDGAPREQLLVVAARRTMVTGLVEAVREAGLKAEGVDLSAFALLRTLGQPAGDDEPARAYCHLAGVTNLAVARGLDCLFTRPLGSAYTGADVSVDSLAKDIRMSIDYYLALADVPPVAEIVLSGPGALAEGLAEGVAERVGHPVIVAEPLREMASELPPGEDPYRHTVAAGLAMGAGA